MNDGLYVYYTIQHRVTHKNQWGKPSTPLEPLADLQDFVFSNFDWMGHYAEPKNQSEDLYNVRAKTGDKGWWTRKSAFNALKRLHKASEAGKLDYKDGYGNLRQRVRFQFRVVKMTVSQTTEVLYIL